MGRGNIIIKKNNTRYNTYYIEYYSHSDEINEETNEPFCNKNPCICNEFFYDDVLGNILCLPDEDISQRTDYVFKTKHCLIIFEDNEWSLAFACIPNISDEEELNEEQERLYKEEANRIMRKIHNIYNLSIPTSAWTSGDLPKETTIYY